MSDLRYCNRVGPGASDDPSKRGADGTRLDRADCSEVLYFLNTFAAKHNLTKEHTLKCEHHLYYGIDRSIQSRAEIENLLNFAYKTL